MSCTREAARSCGEPVTAILNLRGRYENSGCSVAHWRMYLAPRPRIFELVRRDAGEMIGGHVADAVAAGLDRMHLDRREQRQDVRHLLQLRPVVLDVLPRREVTVVAVVLARDAREHAHLRRRQQAVRNRDAQHRRVLLDVQAVAQPQGLELVFGELPGEEAPRLVAELRDTLLDEPLIDRVVAIHARRL